MADDDDASSVQYTSFLSGETHELKYHLEDGTQPMLVKHVMAESSGIGYDQWADMDLWLQGPSPPPL